MRKKYVSFRILVILFLLCFIGSCRNKQSQIISQVQKVGQLATVEFTIKKMAFIERNRKFLVLNLPNATYLADTKMKISAGIDLGKIKPDAFEFLSDKAVKISLPDIRILNISYPSSGIVINTQYTRNAFLNRINVSSMEQMNRLSELELRRYINNLGIREVAQKKTEDCLRQLLSHFGYEIDVNFPEVKNSAPLFIVNNAHIENMQNRLD